MTLPPRRPQERLPQLAPGAARRLVRLDVLRTPRADGTPAVSVRASATDEVGPDRRVVGQARLQVDVDAQGRVAALRSEPALPAGTAGTLVGARVVGGLRAAARLALHEAPEDGPSPLAALLEDVPVAVLISGYLDVRAGTLGRVDGAQLRDVCSGWRADGAPLAELDRTGVVPVSELTAVDDARLGEPFPVLPAGALRRVRWVDVEPASEGASVRAGFRDSSRDGDGPEGVLHEYALTARAVPGGELADVRAEPRVLPFAACLLAVDPASAVGGVPATLPVRVPRLLPGTSGCTHLSDLLRSLACLPRLLRLLPAGGAPAALAV